ncbi:conserved membrane hypothetical protein [Paraburkholderia tropica]|uniref:hypothetical protein n=1 Tax=Paraburkholderia tropica TaxID=92647 RepID=UPI001CAE61B6|nr:hypothetical protein [Paraburkholderia tropica]CAG9197408.1 conserved membrane hypothetical protein [Paraburkholderia tropica]
MKPLLRIVLIVDALTLLGFGVLFLLTPWTSLYNALQLVQAQPALIGQAFGVVLIGFAWLALRGAIDGAMTASVGRTAGHVIWIAGVLMLVWLIGLHEPRLTGFGQLVAGAVGVWLIIVGLGGARLAGAVKQRDRVLASEAAAQEREARAAAKARRDEPVVYAKPVFAREKAAPAVEPVVTEPVAPGVTTTTTTTTATASQPVAGAADAAEAADARVTARDEAADAPRPPLRG